MWQMGRVAAGKGIDPLGGKEEQAQQTGTLPRRWNRRSVTMVRLQDAAGLRTSKSDVERYRKKREGVDERKYSVAMRSGRGRAACFGWDGRQARLGGATATGACELASL